VSPVVSRGKGDPVEAVQGTAGTRRGSGQPERGTAPGRGLGHGPWGELSVAAVALVGTLDTKGPDYAFLAGPR
jgi:hypothetical protein